MPEFTVELAVTDDELRALEHLGTVLGMSVENVIRTAVYHELGRQDLDPSPELFRRRSTDTRRRTKR